MIPRLKKFPALPLIMGLFLSLTVCAPKKHRPTSSASLFSHAPSAGRKCGLICKIKEKRNEKNSPPTPSPARPPPSPPVPHPTNNRPAEKTPEAAKEKEEKKKDDQENKKSESRESGKDHGKNETGRPAAPPVPPRGKGVYHTVKKGETLWRICRTYGADMNEVARVNGIADPTAIEVGQRIWIPGAERVLEVPPPPTATLVENGKPKTPEPAAAGPSTRGTLLFPVPGGKISSRFGPRNGRMHEGIDILAPLGADVLAAEDGKVVYSDNRMSGYGNMIIIKHVGNIYTVYAHNQKNLVKVGDFVKRGQKIAEIGQTGNASAPHLHFEVRVGEKPVNPELYLP